MGGRVGKSPALQPMISVSCDKSEVTGNLHVLEFHLILMKNLWFSATKLILDLSVSHSSPKLAF